MKTLNRTITCIIVSITALWGCIFLYPEETEPAPKPSLKISFIERLRFEGWDNSITLSDNNTDANAYTRHRTSLMLQWNAHPSFELAVKLTNEFRNYFSPKTATFKIHEVFVDQLYFKWKSSGKLPLVITAGRHDMVLGEGFVVADGTPLDGSRSYYFNGVRIDSTLDKNKKHQLTAFFHYMPSTDNLLPVINSQDQRLIEQPEYGAGLYYSGKIKKTGFEAYIIRKIIDDAPGKPIKSGINTIGTRILHPLSPKLSITAEGAYQTGTRGDFNRAAWGGCTHLDYQFDPKTPVLKTAAIGGIFLSGDDPKTEKYEAWDPLFSRWPKWSDSYIYTFIGENGVAFWSNFNSIYGSMALKITDPMVLSLGWHHLASNEIKPGAFPGGTGKSRGNLIIARLDFTLNKHTKGRLIWENFNPGNYYFYGADNANWLQFELIFKY